MERNLDQQFWIRIWHQQHLMGFSAIFPEKKPGCSHGARATHSTLENQNCGGSVLERYQSSHTKSRMGKHGNPIMDHIPKKSEVSLSFLENPSRNLKMSRVLRPRDFQPAQFWQRLWSGKVGLHTSVYHPSTDQWEGFWKVNASPGESIDFSGTHGKRATSALKPP